MTGGGLDPAPRLGGRITGFAMGFSDSRGTEMSVSPVVVSNVTLVEILRPRGTSVTDSIFPLTLIGSSSLGARKTLSLVSIFTLPSALIPLSMPA